MHISVERTEPALNDAAAVAALQTGCAVPLLGLIEAMRRLRGEWFARKQQIIDCFENGVPT